MFKKNKLISYHINRSGGISQKCLITQIHMFYLTMRFKIIYQLIIFILKNARKQIKNIL